MAVPSPEDKKAFAEIWSMVLGELNARVSVPTYQLWIESTQLAYLDASTAVVTTAGGDFIRSFLEERYLTVMRDILESVTGYCTTMYILSREKGEPDLSPFTQPVDETEQTEVIPGDSQNPSRTVVRHVKRETVQATPIRPNGDYTFDNYIVGENNKLAQASSYAVANNPGSDTTNPLFIYGESGLGKTHLLYAIMNEILRTHPGLSVVYVKGEEFTNEMIDSIRQKTQPAFRQKYRGVDVLLIDDIQFIAGKEGIQEEFFHTFEALHEDGRQIVLAADRPPRDMKQLENRLRTRFEGGVLADVQPPGYELRVAILKTKAHNIGLTLSKEIVTYLANNLRTNIRQLEGAVKKIAALSFISGDPPTLSMAKVSVSELMGKDEPTPVKAEKIIARVAAKYNLTPADIRSRRKSKEIAMARHICIYLIRQSTDMTYTALGELFQRDHTTIMSSISVIETEMKQNPQFELEISDLLKG